MAGLRGARFVTAIETEDGTRWAESKIKSLTGGDKIAARFMRCDFFEFTPEFKLVIAGNHKPSLRSVDEATIRSLTPHERRRFRLTNFINSIGEQSARRRANPSCAPAENTLELEMAASLAKELGPPPHGGSWLPLSIKAASGLDSKTGSAGGVMSGEAVGDIVDALRAQSKLLTLGARLLTVQRSTVFPTETSVMDGSWTDENPGADVGESAPSLGQLSATAHSFASTCTYSRTLASQSSADVEAWLRTRIAKSHAQALDKAGICGSGAENEPVGLLTNDGVGSVPAGDNGAAPTADLINSLEATVGAANVDEPTAFLTNSKMRSRLRKIPEIASGVIPLWNNNSMLGHPASVSNQIPSTLSKGSSSDCSAIIYGNFSYLLVIQFQAAIEVLVDPYSRKKSGVWEITSYGSYDIVLTQPAAFAVIADARDV